jgi:thiol-disulfide isomerase/thioredoxin
MKRTITLAAVFLLPLGLAAQAMRPAGCTRDAQNWFTTAYAAARDSAARAGGKAVDVRGLLAARTERTRTCAAQFDVARTAGPALLDLSTLYAQVGDDSLAQAAVDKRLAEPGLTETDKAAALATMIRALIKADTLLIVRAEPYMNELDAMSDAVRAQKIAAHGALDGEYRYLDVDPRIRQHSMAIIALGRGVKATPMSDRSAGAVNAFSLLEAYVDMAEVYADLGHVDSTMMILDRAAADHPEIPDSVLDELIKPERARYALVGHAAVALTANHWLNLPPGPHTLDPAGHVTVVEFTAHWCIPCRNSYPSMVAMNDRFAKQDAHFVFATQFYGYLGDRQNLDSTAEFAADRGYFVGDHGVHFPVAVADAPPPYKPGTPFVSNINDQHYQVGGIPQTVIIDRHGVIRRILTGWDTGNAERMSVLLAQLLKEGS